MCIPDKDDFLKTLATMECGDMTLLWYSHRGQVGVTVIPTARLNDIPVHREYLPGDAPAQRGLMTAHKRVHANNAVTPEPCLQLKLAEDPIVGGDFRPGLCSRNCKAVVDAKLEALECGDGKAVLRFSNVSHPGLSAVQEYHYSKGDRHITVNTTLRNDGDKPLRVEYLASFSLGMLSPFQPGAGKDCYEVLQWHAAWSGEGHLEVRAAEDACLEQSWNSWDYRGLRIGSTTSMPVFTEHPQLALHDKKAHVVWGASLAAFGPWIMELTRSADFMALSGGLPDRECNGWFKDLKPGEELTGPEAAISVCTVPADVSAADAICNRLAPYCGTTPENIPAGEEELPALFNDWCFTWGHPSRENLLPVAKRLQGSGVAYLTMDYGWFYGGEWASPENGKEGMGDMGDWNVLEENYPNGFDAWLDEIRSYGLKPGVWFELENACKSSIVNREHPEWMLTLDGRTLQHTPRVFFDFRKPEVQEYLHGKVIEFLKRHRLGYVKSDYNAPIGSYCDGESESKAENARQVIEAQADFYRRLRQELPDITIEICSSGGRRISPAWMRLGTISSSSDAHEGVEIPLLAANTAMLMAARNNQVWATLHAWDDDERLMYSLLGGCIGRLCLSGDVDKLSEKQMAIVHQALDFYQTTNGIRKAGDNFLYRRLKSRSYGEPEGAQLFTRVALDGASAMAVLHAFGNADANTEWVIPGKWRIANRFALSAVNASATVEPDGAHTCLTFNGIRSFSADALLLEKI